MKLTFAQPHISITQLAPTELPDFTILTGLNGSGKTHFLNAINQGFIVVEGVPHSKIQYYSLGDFQLAAAGTHNSQSIIALTNAAWQQFTGVAGNPKVNWKPTAKAYFDQSFGVDADPTEIVWFNDRQEGESAEAFDKRTQYLDGIRDNIFANPQFTKQPHYNASIMALKACRKPLHVIEESEFSDHFAPSTQGGSHLSASLGSKFTKYKIAQYLWAHRQFDRSDELISRSDRFAEYTRTTTPPWVIINEILRKIHELGGENDVFNFQVTHPSDEPLTFENHTTFSFQPQLVDLVHGGPRQFDALSSGEKALLALAISIYHSDEYFELPKVLLLDEVDASLHPSMSRALVETLRSVFVARDVSIILATHSPSTIAIAPEESIHVISKADTPDRIRKQNHKHAINLLSQVT